jgi:hypothetical protein
LNANESIEQCAERELGEETNIRGVALEQVKLFSAPDRDPRGHYISVVFYGLVDAETVARAGDDAAIAKWFSISALPADIAFDHADMIRAAIRAAFLRGSIHAQSRLYALSLKAEKLFPTERGLAQAVAHVSGATVAPDLETAQRIATVLTYEHFPETTGWTGQDGHASEIPVDLLRQALKAQPGRC